MCFIQRRNEWSVNGISNIKNLVCKSEKPDQQFIYYILSTFFNFYFNTLSLVVYPLKLFTRCHWLLKTDWFFLYTTDRRERWSRRVAFKRQKPQSLIFFMMQWKRYIFFLNFSMSLISNT